MVGECPANNGGEVDSKWKKKGNFRTPSARLNNEHGKGQEEQIETITDMFNGLDQESRCKLADEIDKIALNIDRIRNPQDYNGLAKSLRNKANTGGITKMVLKIGTYPVKWGLDGISIFTRELAYAKSRLDPELSASLYAISDYTNNEADDIRSKYDNWEIQDNFLNTLSSKVTSYNPEDKTLLDINNNILGIIVEDRPVRDLPGNVHIKSMDSKDPIYAEISESQFTELKEMG